MTIPRRDGNDTEFGNWLRVHPLLKSRFGYDAENLDYIWFAYREGWFILIEEKRHGKAQQPAQRDTHSIVHQLLKNIPNGTKVSTWRGDREIEYRGYYLIQFEKTNPDDSKWIKINGEVYDKLDLLYLLKYGVLAHYDWSLPIPILVKKTGLNPGQIQKIMGE